MDSTHFSGGQAQSKVDKEVKDVIMRVILLSEKEPLPANRQNPALLPAQELYSIHLYPGSEQEW